MVSDVYRTLLNGGIFMYPETTALPKGKLRLLYECYPMAFIVEQAGGKAVDCRNTRILDVPLTQIHQRSSIYLGFTNQYGYTDGTVLTSESGLFPGSVSKKHSSQFYTRTHCTCGSWPEGLPVQLRPSEPLRYVLHQ